MKHTRTQFSTLNEAVLWANSYSSMARTNARNSEKLTRVISALALFDNPQNSFKSIHITGSKGKSSTGYACSCILHSLEKRVGLFTSPHIHSYNERIQINHNPIDDAMLLNTLNSIYKICSDNALSLTMFEIFTLCACIVFKVTGVEYAVFEVGIGGRYDTTNFLQPVLCLITQIEKEHADILGNTIALIAKDKAGIIKPNTPVWIGRQVSPIVLDILLAEAAEQGAMAYNISDYIRLNMSQSNTTHQIEAKIEYILQETSNTGAGYNITKNTIAHWNNILVQSPSISKVLVENQILSDIAIHEMLQLNPTTTSHTYAKEIQASCRSELIALDHMPKLYLDGAHTENSVYSSMQSISAFSSKIIVVVALSKGKDCVVIANAIAKFKSIIAKIIVTTTGRFEKINSEALYTILHSCFDNVVLIEDEDHAMQHALATSMQESKSLLCVLGSFYLCADCRAWWFTNAVKNL